MIKYGIFKNWGPSCPKTEMEPLFSGSKLDQQLRTHTKPLRQGTLTFGEG